MTKSSRLLHRNTNTAFWLSMVICLIASCVSGTAFAQNKFESGDGWDNEAGWGNGADFAASAGTSQIYTAKNNGTGNQYYRLRTGTTTHGPAGGVDELHSMETEYTPLYTWGANGGKAYYINVGNTTYNYVFKTPTADGVGNTPELIVFEVQGTVNTISSVTQSLTNVFPGNTLTVTATVSGATTLPTGQGIYLRYTDDGWATSTIAEMTYSGSGGNYTSDIGAGVNVAAANVEYYVFTSGDGLTITGSKADWYTINLNNNTGSNYSYGVSNCSYYSITDGDWNVGATWNSGVPPENSNVCIFDQVTLDDNHAVTDCWIGPSGTLLDASHTFTVKGNLSNAGTYSGTGKMYFASAAAQHMVSGGGTYGNVELNDAQNLQIANGGTITGNLTITAGTFTLTGAAPLAVAGNVTITSTLVLSSTAGGDLSVGGDWTRASSGTFTPASRLVSFNGTGTQTVSVTGGGTQIFDYLRVDKASGNLRADDTPATNLRIHGTSGDVLQLANGDIDLNGRELRFSGSGGNIWVDGGARSITGGAGSSILITGTDAFTSKTMSRSDGSSTLTIGTNVKLTVIHGGINFGSGITTVNDTLEFQTQAFCDSNSPTYGASSVLVYNVAGTFQRRIEWNDASLQDVVIKSGTTLDTYTWDKASLRSLNGNLLIKAGGSLRCGVSPNNRSADIAIGGNLTIAGTLDMDDMDQASIDVAGDVTISSGGTLDLSNLIGGDVKTGGHFTNNGTFNCNDRAVFFDGSANQNVGGSSAITIDYLLMQNTGPGITLQAPVTVNDTLYMQDGVITTTVTNLLSIATTGGFSAADPGSVDSYFNGPLAKDFSAAVEMKFPLGKNGRFGAIGITPDAATACTFRCEYFDYNAGLDAYDISQTVPSLNHVSSLEYWEATRTSGTTDAKTTLYWGSHSNVGGTAPSNAALRVAHWHAGDGEWKDEGNSAVSGTTASGSLTSNTMTSWSPVTTASIDNSNPLPIQLLAFEAAPTSTRTVQLDWTTATETNNARFTIERAAASQPEVFTAIGSLSGAGTTSETNTYQWIDEAALSGLSFYRLRQTDFDGTSSLSHIERVNLGNQGAMEVAGVPFADHTALLIQSPENQAVSIQIIDLYGKLIWSRESIALIEGQQQIPLQSLRLTRGQLYIAEVTGRDETCVTKLVGQ